MLIEWFIVVYARKIRRRISASKLANHSSRSISELPEKAALIEEKITELI
jgi:hypothetical protein